MTNTVSNIPASGIRNRRLQNPNPDRPKNTGTYSFRNFMIAGIPLFLVSKAKYSPFSN